MQLLVDVGNSRTKFCFNDANCLSEITSLDNALINLEYLEDLFDLKCLDNLNKIVVSNVSQQSISDCFKSFGQLKHIDVHQIKTESNNFGVQICYQQPESLGVDRWLVMLGAVSLFPEQGLIIVDSGTATTLDVISADGLQQGGWILPGIDTMFTSLLENTENVAAKKVEQVELSLGKNTSDCVNKASWAATIGLVNQANLLLENNDKKVIVTGGNGKKLSQLLSIDNEYVEHLMFHGLKCYL